MILGCEREEEENPGTGCNTRPARRAAPRNLLQLSASASNALTDNPPSATEARPRQEDFFPTPFRLPPEWSEPPEAAEKGALPLRPHFLRPCWVEEEEGVVEACCCDRGTTGETPPRSAEEADEDPSLDSPAEDFRGIFGGCNVRSWSGQRQARKMEKFQETREGQHNICWRPLQPGP